MKITMIAVGQRQPAWAQAAVNDYLARFPADFKVDLKEVKAEPRSGKGNDPIQRLMAAEAVRIRSVAPAGGRIVALDERGAD
jgi:23S rRNA (pseudouridine1915-N3)-methyltransferase